MLQANFPSGWLESISLLVPLHLTSNTLAKLKLMVSSKTQVHFTHLDIGLMRK